MDIEGIYFCIINKDNYLIAPLANADKKADKSLSTPTRLDGDEVRYHPELLDKMEDDGTPQLLSEIIHMSLMHPERKKAITTGMRELDPIFDIAADLATFHNITESSKFVMPKDLGYEEGKSAEEYFSLLSDTIDQKGINMSDVQQESQQGQGQQGKGEGEGQGKEGEGEGQGSAGAQASSAYNNLLEKLGVKGKQKQDHSQWGSVPLSAQHSFKSVMINALKSRGDLPMGLKRLLHLLEGETQVRWTDRLRKLVGTKVAATHKRYTMMKPSRRFGIPHPGTKRLKKGLIACHLDTSGSMDDMDTAIAIKETKGIADAYGAPFLFMCGDCETPNADRILSKYDMDKIQIKGGGGTDHRPVFKYLEDKKEPVDLLILFTDTYTCWPEHPPKYQVIVVTCTQETNGVPSWCEVIHIDKKE